MHEIWEQLVFLGCFLGMGLYLYWVSLLLLIMNFIILKEKDELANLSAKNFGVQHQSVHVNIHWYDEMSVGLSAYSMWNSRSSGSS